MSKTTQKFLAPKRRDIELTFYVNCGHCDEYFDMFNYKKYRKLAIEIVSKVFPNKKMKFKEEIDCPFCGGNIKIEELYHQNTEYVE